MSGPLGRGKSLLLKLKKLQEEAESKKRLEIEETDVCKPAHSTFCTPAPGPEDVGQTRGPEEFLAEIKERRQREHLATREERRAEKDATSPDEDTIRNLTSSLQKIAMRRKNQEIAVRELLGARPKVGSDSAGCSSELSSDESPMLPPSEISMTTEKNSQPKVKSDVVTAKDTIDKKIGVEMNYVRLKQTSEDPFVEYHVKFDPALDSKQARFYCLSKVGYQLGRNRDEVPGGLVPKTFDGAVLCLPYYYRMKEKETVLQTEYPPHFKNVTLRITETRQVKLSDPTAAHMYNVLFKRIMDRLKLVQIRRNHYMPEKANLIEHLKLEVWPGYVTAIQELEGGLFLICDVSHKVLRSDTVLQLMADKNRECKARKLDPLKEIKRDLLGMTVLTRYNNKFYRIDDIDFDTTPRDTFTNSAGKKITYYEYYKMQYDITIGDLDQPMLLVSRSKHNRPSDFNTIIHLVPELCNLTGIMESFKSNFTFMRELSNSMRTTPASRSLSIQKFVAAVKENDDCVRLLAAYGLELEDAALRLDGRVLNPVSLHLGNNQREHVHDDFTNVIQRSKVISGCPLEKWVVICEAKLKHLAQDFVKEFIAQSEGFGMLVHEPRMAFSEGGKFPAALANIDRAAKDGAELIFVIQSSKRSDKYAAVKKKCYVEHGIPCQVLVANTLKCGLAKKKSIIQKIGLQVNAKLGGELWGCWNPYDNAMVVGIDVYHSPDGESSWCGFVASLNRLLTRWSSFAEEQKPGIELLDSIQKLLRMALQQYFEVNRKFPSKVIVYRDGVGDGNLQYVLHHEILQLKTTLERSICKIAEGAHVPPSVPPVSVIVVSKRINTRFLELTPAEVVNPPPGTVVDHTIVKKGFPNFYMVSQKVTQGTVTPTHYCVVTDAIGMGLDRIQQLTYRLCYLYYNTTAPVRVPAPCLYAHRLAGLTGEYLKRQSHYKLSNYLFYL